MRKICAIFFLFIFLCGTTQAFEANSASLYANREKLISQQVDLLKERLTQAESQYKTLQAQNETQLSSSILNRTNKQLLNQSTLDIAVAKSNVDSLNIELSESQQTIVRLEKEILEIENQLNVYDIFGVKIVRTDIFDIHALKVELNHLEKLIDLEKSRASNLTKLQTLAIKTLELQKNKFTRINTLLKSRTIVQLKEQQVQSEVNFQQQQSYWLQRLNALYNQQNAQEAAQTKPRAKENLDNEIFYANENLNFTYLQMLVVRYQDQLQQLRIAISHSNSITILNKASDQVAQLSKQVVKVSDLLKSRLKLLDNRKKTYAIDSLSTEEKNDFTRLEKLSSQYKLASNAIDNLSQKLLTFRSTVDQALQHELSSRQGLPGFSAQAWKDLGDELWLVPTLTLQVVKSLTFAVFTAVQAIDYKSTGFIALFEIIIGLVYFFTRGLLQRSIQGMAEYELGHINLKRLSLQLLQRTQLDIFVIFNISALFYFCNIPAQSSSFLINLAFVWLFFKVITTIARICLVETVHDRSGHDVLLYKRLKWSFLVGGVITALTIFMHQLPLNFEVKDLFDRLFLVFLLVVSIFLLRSWEIVPSLMIAHMDERRLYLKKTVRLLGFLIPLILLVNSAIGLFGFVNLVLTMSWYESIFIWVLVSYLVARGLMVEGMMSLSTLIIRHVGNGWLWTEAFLKPIDRVLRLLLLVGAGVLLFYFYGWNQQSLVVTRLHTILNYPLVDMLNTSITLLSLLELAAFIAFLFWSARWTREFVFRALATRTTDMGLRNSIAIFCQYALIIVGIFICLRMLGIDFKALAFVMTGFAVAVGFGLRDLANNFVCGFILLIERPVRVGDIVSINEHEGEVTHIGSRAVTVRTWDYMDVLVPNAEIFSKSFINWTAKDYIVRTKIAIKINRHDSPHFIQSLIMDILDKHKDVLSDPAPEVLFKEMDDSLIEFEVRYFLNLRQVKSRLILRSEILLLIWDEFANAGVKPPYPHHEVHLRNEFSFQERKPSVLLPATDQP